MRVGYSSLPLERSTHNKALCRVDIIVLCAAQSKPFTIIARGLVRVRVCLCRRQQIASRFNRSRYAKPTVFCLLK